MPLICFLLAGCPRSGPRPGEPPAPPAPPAPAAEAADTVSEAAQPAAEPEPLAADTVESAPDTLEEPEPPPPPPPLRICAGGDLLIGNNLDTLWASRASMRLGYPVSPFPDPDSLLAPLRPLVRGADIVLVNVEGAIGEGEAPSKCRPGSTRCYAFRQPIPVAAALARLAEPGALVGNIANNHALDAGGPGFESTVRHLTEAGVAVTGADTLATPVAVMSGGDTVAILGFSVFRAGPDAHDMTAVRRHVARAAARYSRVIVTMHMGAEGREAQRTPDEIELFAGEDRGNSVAFARAAVEAGASLVLGHGPHVLRAGEWSGDALILYSLGNLLTYGPFNMREPNSRGVIACAAIDAEGSVIEAFLRPTYQRPPGLVGPDPTERALQLVDSLSQLDFPETGVSVGEDGTIRRRSPGDKSSPPNRFIGNIFPGAQ